MKTKTNYLFGLLTALCLLSGCDDNFDEINTNKVDPTTLAPSFVMNKAIIDATYLDGFGTLQMLCYEFGIVQQIITPYGSSLAGANYNQNNVSNTPLVWQNFYRNVLKQIVDVVEKTKDDPNRTNLYHMARIWKAYSFMILTDTYGDIPYTEAAKGYISEITSPKYDSQEFIYRDILKELDEASAGLDAAKAVESTDILYGGNVVKWKRFGYSLMLRAGMRLVKVDPTTARNYVTKAVTGGVMQSNDDNAVMRHTALYNNWIANHLQAREKTNFYLAAPFVNYLKTNNDPRLGSIAVRYVGAKGGPEQVDTRASSDPKVQVGMPMGYDNVTISTPAVLAQYGVASLWDFSQVNLKTVLKLDAPEFHVTYSQTQLLLAEAAQRGWITGSAADYYTKGVRANMEQMATFDPAAAIPEAAIQAYLTAHPFDPARALEQINTQYWVASFLNGPELFANFRRSGFPALAKNPYPASEITEDFIRRMPYPDSETVVNQQNVNEAIARQGPNTLSTRVWWDKK
ncbi:SusD-like starch-binding protein associating with outer membrane [Larkinella arboricola]|uniref:SusD-like starch-binding protein associating with outer membrane n=1 Tax=Larkinella arboricola TaxID=643671 RepID=A0A327WM05_LARAB|nr:SusD/RagB family nutrient-binding outer membrane lipoprotein [Larkinella arboricola]RAJ92547.1 SusD-like starch-binding protein associating with outer membrane [Larkinella arboricola]